MKQKTKKEATSISCDWKSPIKGKTIENKNRIFRFKGNFKWRGIRTEKYKQKNGGWSAIERNVLIGSHGESAKFHLRYFEIAPNGYSSFEKHKHEHVVICVRGKGKVLVGKKIQKLEFLDTLYIAPHTPHQLINPFNEPFGFFCIVNARRDRPKILKKSKN